jgi:hypothetical protein
MIGLKSFLKEFADYCDDGSFDALYERQRELVRCGLLPVRGGRGPGSGVPLTAETLATFLIGLLATDSLSEVGPRTEQFCNARPIIVGAKKNTRSKSRTLHSDLSKVLSGGQIVGFNPSDDKERLYGGLQITRYWKATILQYQEVKAGKNHSIEGVQGIEYLASHDEWVKSPIISRTASLETDGWWMLVIKFRHALAT